MKKEVSKRLTLRFNGFEDLRDLERDVVEAIEEMGLDPEFQGTLTVSFFYSEE